MTCGLAFLPDGTTVKAGLQGSSWLILSVLGKFEPPQASVYPEVSVFSVPIVTGLFPS